MFKNSMKAHLVLLLLFGCFFFTSDASADIKPGFRVGVYTDPNDFFVGGELLVTLTPYWYFNPNVEYVFIDNGDLFTINFDVHYDFRTNSSFYFWIGGGPAILLFDPEGDRDGDTDLGVNVFAGIGFPLRDTSLIPYIQPKVILADNSEFSLAFGIRF